MKKVLPQGKHVTDRYGYVKPPMTAEQQYMGDRITGCRKMNMQNPEHSYQSVRGGVHSSARD